ncbi:MAG: hypothetical protein ACI9YE_001629, partial [Psychroserpens sp.]
MIISILYLFQRPVWQTFDKVLVTFEDAKNPLW